MAVSAPTSRSDISKLREEKKRREEEARRKGQEAEAAKAKAGERKPSIGYPEKQQEEQSAPLMPGGRTDNTRRVNRQMDRMVRVAREGREADRRAAESRDKVNSQIDRMVRVVGAESEAYDNAKKTAKAMSPHVAKGLGLLGSLSNLGTMTGATGAIAENVGKAIPDPDRPKPVTRTPGERVDDMGVFADKKDIDRRQEAKEIQDEVDAEDYADAYDLYARKARARGDAENTIMSPEEFVDEMSGTQQSEDGLGRERVGPMVSAGEVASNLDSFQTRSELPDGTGRYAPGDTPLNLDGELGDYSRLPDEDNASRLRSIINDRKAKEPNSPLAAGVDAAAKATRVDPYTGLPMVEGGGSRIEGVPGRDGSPSSAQQFTRATPPEVMEQANQLPTAAERDLYIGRNAIDMAALPEDQRERAARDYAESRRKLRERGNMVPAATDPKTGYYVQVDENNNIIRDDDGNSMPILDADGNPRRSEISSARTKDGNVIPGSQDVVFIRSEEALKRGEQRKNFNNRMQEARNSGNNLIMSFVSRDPETNDLKFDEAGFESQYPGSLPPPGPKRTEAISQLTNMIERGRAVQQNRDRLGRRQQESSPTFGPILMRESLQQAETPEEAAMLALYFNRPDIAQFYQQQAMGDRAILAEEQKARAAAELAALRSGRNGNFDTPSGLADQIDLTVNDAVAGGNLNSAIATLASGPNAVMSERDVRDKAFANDSKASPGAALLKPMHRPLLKEVFESADDGWKPVEKWKDEDILNAEQKFADELSRRYGFNIGNDEDGMKLRQVISNIFQSLWEEIHGPDSGRFFGGKAYPRRQAQETTGVGLPDDEQPGTQPGWVDAFF